MGFHGENSSLRADGLGKDPGILPVAGANIQNHIPLFRVIMAKPPFSSKRKNFVPLGEGMTHQARKRRKVGAQGNRNLAFDTVPPMPIPKNSQGPPSSPAGQTKIKEREQRSPARKPGHDLGSPAETRSHPDLERITQASLKIHFGMRSLGHRKWAKRMAGGSQPTGGPELDCLAKG